MQYKYTYIRIVDKKITKKRRNIKKKEEIWIKMYKNIEINSWMR